MMRAGSRTALLLVLILPVPLATSQGLGDAAARERARRSKQQAKAGDSGQSFSNADLERGRPAGAAEKQTPEPTPAPEPPASGPEGSSEATPSESTPSGPPSPPPTPPPSRIPELEARIKALQDKLNPMSGSYIFGPFGSNDPTEEPRVREELQRLEAELATARQEAANAGTALQRPAGPSRR